MSNFNLNKPNILEVETIFGYIRIATNDLTKEQIELYTERFKSAQSTEEFLSIQSELFEEININTTQNAFEQASSNSFFSGFGGLENLFKKDMFGQAFRPFQNLFMDNITEEQIDRQIERLTKLKQDLVKHREEREKEEQKKQQRNELLKHLSELEVKLRSKNEEFLAHLTSVEATELIRNEMIEIQNQIADVKAKLSSL